MREQSEIFVNFAAEYKKRTKMTSSRTNRIIICLIGLLSLFGASRGAAQFRYGPSAGIDVTTLKYKQDLFTIDRSVGYSAGIAAEMMFPGIGFGIDFGLLYEQKGATLHLSERELWSWQHAGDPRTYLHYVSVPFHLRFKYTRLGGFEDTLAPFAFAGPTFGFLVGHSNVPALEYAGGDVGVEVGIGAELMRHLQISGSYTWGMTYAQKLKILTDCSARNRMWMVRLTWLF